ncbi:SDR family NAD(P)-dependent oxidoreductase [Acidocella sp. KAb 2-4]|uniref:SDR family NAD(P)-dependent oxidoreductase n=1 Tax=Acidocella sp. KAb 2-4 TaxID=2885158 RepID=UPI001D097C8D|nr:SDR family oxidoreductase [Acidocella sp. KAb 2-4]MCB5945611.1 SDR family oxidoreductase [Acidocella sp. KAb 2-4]
MRQRFQDKTVLVTGGAGGAGEAAARMFAAEGARVGIIDRAKENGERVAAEIAATGAKAAFAQADVSRAAEVNAAVEAITKALGAPTVLFNHAGTIIVKPFLETTEEEWDWLMAVNVKSMFLVTKAVLPGMIAAGGGSIVCTSSISAIAATPMEVVYNTSKGAVHMFARAIAVDFREQNIRCNAVCPGFIRTPHGMNEVAKLTALGVDASESVIAAQQGRMCEPEEVARAALFLASDDASFINGTHLFVDNGFTAV